MLFCWWSACVLDQAATILFWSRSRARSNPWVAAVVIRGTRACRHAPSDLLELLAWVLAFDEKVVHRPANPSALYGLPGLTDWEKNLADSDAALLLKQVGLLIRSEECRERHRVRTAFLLESPQDPLTYVPQAREEESPSFWAWPDLMQLLRYQGMGLVSFDQGCFGHSRRKPTTCLTNLEDMRDLEDQRSTMHSEPCQRTSRTVAICRPHGRYGHRD